MICKTHWVQHPSISIAACDAGWIPFFLGSMAIWPWPSKYLDVHPSCDWLLSKEAPNSQVIYNTMSVHLIYRCNMCMMCIYVYTHNVCTIYIYIPIFCKITIYTKQQKLRMESISRARRFFFALATSTVRSRPPTRCFAPTAATKSWDVGLDFYGFIGRQIFLQDLGIYESI